MIKHLVISGGDISYFSMLGTIKALIKKNINITNLENIYAVSAGSMIGLLLCLKLDYNEIIINYFIERPWEKLLKFNSDDFLNLYESLGIINEELFYGVFIPLLKSCEFDENITMLELFEYSNIKLNIYSTKYSDLSLHCFNHVNNPDIKVLDAIFMSCSIPILFKPLKINDDYYIDGGYNCTFPMQFCIEENENKSDILGIYSDASSDPTKLNEDENILSFYAKLLLKLILKKREDYQQISDENSVNRIIIFSEMFSIERFMKTINDKAYREELINIGENAAKLYLEYNDLS